LQHKLFYYKEALPYVTVKYWDRGWSNPGAIDAVIKEIIAAQIEALRKGFNLESRLASPAKDGWFVYDRPFSEENQRLMVPSRQGLE